MYQAVEFAEGVEQLVGQVVVIFLYCGFQIQRADRRFRITGSFDFIVHGFQLAQRAAQQYYAGAVGGAAQGAGAADAVAGAGDQNDSTLQQIRCGTVIKHGKTPVVVAAPARGAGQRHSR